MTESLVKEAPTKLKPLPIPAVGAVPLYAVTLRGRRRGGVSGMRVPSRGTLAKDTMICLSEGFLCLVLSSWAICLDSRSLALWVVFRSSYGEENSNNNNNNSCSDSTNNKSNIKGARKPPSAQGFRDVKVFVNVCKGFLVHIGFHLSRCQGCGQGPLASEVLGH